MGNPRGTHRGLTGDPRVVKNPGEVPKSASGCGWPRAEGSIHRPARWEGKEFNWKSHGEGWRAREFGKLGRKPAHSRSTRRRFTSGFCASSHAAEQIAADK